LRGFDPLITLLGEDLDLCWRAQVAGARIVVAPLAKVAHRETVATGERPASAGGTRRASRQDLQRRHQLLVVATGWGRRKTVTTLSMLWCSTVRSRLLSLVSGDTDRAGAIVSVVALALQTSSTGASTSSPTSRDRVLSDASCTACKVGGASRLKRFVVTLAARGVRPSSGHPAARRACPKVRAANSKTPASASRRVL
jgi:hypothetical protein